jgi:hypothetical protein
MKKLIGLGIGLLLFVSNANALDFGVGIKSGTVGTGIDLSAAVTKTINVRLSLTNVDLEGEDETITVGDTVEGDIDAELDLDFGANALLVDWFIFDGGFHLTGGMLRHTGEADLTGTLLSPATFDDAGTISPGDLVGGEISGELKLADSYQPYVGIGWGRKAGKNGGFSLTADLGIVLLDPSVELEATATNPANQATVDAQLRSMEGDADDELEDFEAFPILSLGVNYAF